MHVEESRARHVLDGLNRLAIARKQSSRHIASHSAARVVRNVRKSAQAKLRGSSGVRPPRPRLFEVALMAARLDPQKFDLPGPSHGLYGESAEPTWGETEVCDKDVAGAEPSALLISGRHRATTMHRTKKMQSKTSNVVGLQLTGIRAAVHNLPDGDEGEDVGPAPLPATETPSMPDMDGWPAGGVPVKPRGQRGPSDIAEVLVTLPKMVLLPNIVGGGRRR